MGGGGVRSGGVSTALDHILEAEPERLAVVGPHRRLTYAALDREADAAAAVLAEWGVGAGDRVAACLPNGADIVVAFHATMRLGAVWVGINEALALPEKRELVERAGPTVLLADPARAGDLERLGEGPRSPHLVWADRGDPGSEWATLVRSADGAPRPPVPDPDAPAAVAFTSGTTGLPRGVVHSQQNLLLPGAALVATRGYGPDLRKGDFLPLTILNLVILSTLLTAQAGGCCVLLDRRDAEGIAEGIEQGSVTVWNAVPALLHSMVAEPDRYAGRLRSLREVWTGGADCPEHLRQAFEHAFSVQVAATYGLTEAPSVVTIDPVGGPHVEGASGVALPHLDVCARDDDGSRLAPGVEGEITVAPAAEGPWAGRYRPMLGYWGDDGPDGPDGLSVLRTGDLGWVDESGHLFVHDRKKLLIVRGGANVYPAEVERVLSAAEGVRGCAVLGVPDERLGERVVAVVEVEPGAGVSEDGLRAHCAENLAKYKVPDAIAVMGDLPRNAMGKVQRAALQSLFAGPVRS